MATVLKPALRERGAQWWQLRSKPERAVAALGCAIALTAFAWWALWEPLQRDVERQARYLVAQRAVLAEARRQADDIASLSRNTNPPLPRDARADLDTALSRHGLKPATVDRVDDERLRLTFDAIGFDTLSTLLESLQRDARLRAVELTSTARVEPGQVRADVVLSR
jgi:type II secretory pathway component PulM